MLPLSNINFNTFNFSNNLTRIQPRTTPLYTSVPSLLGASEEPPLKKRKAEVIVVYRQPLNVDKYLPRDVLVIAFSFLQSSELISATSVCKTFCTKPLLSRLLQSQNLTSYIKESSTFLQLHKLLADYCRFKNFDRDPIVHDPISQLVTEGEVLCLAPFDGNKYVSVHKEGYVREWNPLGKQRKCVVMLDLIHSSQGSKTTILDANVHDGQYLYLLREKGSIEVWDLTKVRSRTAEKLLSCKKLAENLTVPCFKGIGHTVAFASCDKQEFPINLWNWKTNKTTTIDTISCLPLTLNLKGNQIVAACNNDSVVMWDISTGEKFTNPTTGLSKAKSITFQNNQVSFLAEGNCLRVRDYKTNTLKFGLKYQFEALTPFGTLLFAKEIGRNSLVIFETNKLEATCHILDAHEDGDFSKIAFDCETRTIALLQQTNKSGRHTYDTVFYCMKF